MSLADNYNQWKGVIERNMTVEKSWDSKGFAGNPLGTCAAQVLMWCKGLAGQIEGGTGLRESLLSTDDQATALQFTELDDGRELTKIASKTVDLRNNNSAKMIEKLTPWSGKYKLYGIGSSKGEGHIIGAYFPWFGSIEFYDPNLVHGKIKESGSIYEILSCWVRIYDGHGGPGAIWGHETLFVIDDPEEALKKLK